ncbi:class I SAM-dependent methyltransferase [Nocardioides sp. W7]|uniref:class I SAM-dependent methyltransferase n=1 Tax=Nocardioides sp. W7 TaxID=2931390 RepID=UPI001FD26D27|nr:class I SAM-dependent methyltransferase [Nocardioides sp. W7]
MTEDSLEEAARVVELVTDYVPDLLSKRVADLGCGVGRHLVALADQASEAVGIESSEALVDIARDFATGAVVEHGSFHDLAEHGAFDVVCAFSHCALLVDDQPTLVRSLQRLRGAMPDYGLLVVEVMPAEAGAIHWSNRGITVEEVRTPTPTGHLHHFDVVAHGRTSAADVHALQVAPDRWRSIAEDCGFQVEATRPLEHPDGSSSLFYFLRATKGFNYLSDLTDFLDSWANPQHPRNRRPITWAAPDATRRVRPAGALALGQGASLSRHHPDFARAIEDRIRPLVLALAEHWNFVSYSSCAGHLVSPGPRVVYSEAYCGLVTFDNGQIASIERLVSEALREVRSVHVEVGLRVRTLHGDTTALTAADVLFRRASHDTAWTAYAAETEHSARVMADRLTKQGGRG